jgi:DNA polymerase-3 subunit delta'
MGFDEFVGNRQVLEAIRGVLEKDRLPHALIFSGPVGVGKYTLAQMLAKAIHCSERQNDFCGQCQSCRTIARADDRWAAVQDAEQAREQVTKRPRELPLVIQHHPDVVVLAPNGPLRLFQIEQARYLKQTLDFLPTGRRRKVFILPDAERMDAAAANSLLKSLEEPPPHALLVLTTSAEAALLPTIRSRCISLWFSPLNKEQVVGFLEQRGVGKNRKDREWRTAICKGSPGAAVRLDLEHYLQVRDSLLALLLAGVEQRDAAAVFAQAQKLSGRAETLESLLDVLYSLLQDILHIGTKASGEPLRNADRPAPLGRLARVLGAGRILQTGVALEDLERNLRRNVPIRLSLEAFAFRLARIGRVSQGLSPLAGGR